MRKKMRMKQMMSMHLIYIKSVLQGLVKMIYMISSYIGVGDLELGVLDITWLYSILLISRDYTIYCILRIYHRVSIFKGIEGQKRTLLTLFPAASHQIDWLPCDWSNRGKATWWLQWWQRVKAMILNESTDSSGHLTFVQLSFLFCAENHFLALKISDCAVRSSVSESFLLFLFTSSGCLCWIHALVDS